MIKFRFIFFLLSFSLWPHKIKLMSRIKKLQMNVDKVCIDLSRENNYFCFWWLFQHLHLSGLTVSAQTGESSDSKFLPNLIISLCVSLFCLMAYQLLVRYLMPKQVGWDFIFVYCYFIVKLSWVLFLTLWLCQK